MLSRRSETGANPIFTGAPIPSQEYSFPPPPKGVGAPIEFARGEFRRGADRVERWRGERVKTKRGLVRTQSNSVGNSRLPRPFCGRTCDATCFWDCAFAGSIPPVRLSRTSRARLRGSSLRLTVARIPARQRQVTIAGGTPICVSMDGASFASRIPMCTRNLIRCWTISR